MNGQKKKKLEVNWSKSRKKLTNQVPVFIFMFYCLVKPVLIPKKARKGRGPTLKRSHARTVFIGVAHRTDGATTCLFLYS